MPKQTQSQTQSALNIINQSCFAVLYKKYYIPDSSSELTFEDDNYMGLDDNGVRVARLSFYFLNRMDYHIFFVLLITHLVLYIYTNLYYNILYSIHSFRLLVQKNWIYTLVDQIVFYLPNGVKIISGSPRIPCEDTQDKTNPCWKKNSSKALK